jgi:hypothetical protein
MRRVVVGFTAALLLGFAGPAKSSPNRKSKSTWAAAGFKRSARTARPSFPWHRLGDQRPSFPQHPTLRPRLSFP